MGLAQDDHSVQAFGFDAANKPFHEWAEIRCQRHGFDGFNSSGPEHLNKGLRIEGVAVVDEVFLFSEKSRKWISQVLGHLLHPVPIGMFHDPGNLDLAGCVISAVIE